MNIELYLPVLRLSYQVPDTRHALHNWRIKTDGNSQSDHRLRRLSALPLDRLLTAFLAVLFLFGAAVPGSAAEDEQQPKVRLYGFILVNTHFNDSEFTPQDIPVAVNHGRRESFSIFPRQSRLGVRLSGPQLDTARLFGQLELDIWGLRGSSSPGGVNQSAPRLRLAFLGLKWERTALTVGQDWVRAFAPLNPTSLSHQSIPLFSSGGNLWNLLPQIRLDHQARVADSLLFQISGAILRPFGADRDPLPVSQNELLGGGEYAAMPFFQFRVALGGRAWEKKWAVGLAGHFGREEYQATKLRTVGLALDLKIPLGRRVVISGELFDGENLKMLYANGYRFGNPDEDPGAVEQNTRGGWLELSVFAGERLNINLAAGLEALDESRVTAGTIRKNQGFSLNMIYALHRRFKIAFELLQLETERPGEPTETGNAVDLALQYVF